MRGDASVIVGKRMTIMMTEVVGERDKDEGQRGCSTDALLQGARTFATPALLHANGIASSLVV